MNFLKGKTLVFTLAVFLLLIFLHSLELLNPIERATFRTLTPIQTYFYKAGIRARTFITNLEKNDNPGETELLKAQIRGLLVQNAKLKLLAAENEILKQELKFDRKHDYELVSARILGTDSIRLSSLLVLEIDNQNYTYRDIGPGMPVITEDGILVGKIATIKQDQIFLMPITAAESAIAATILNKNYTLGTAEGEFNIAIKMRMIPQTETLKQGDLVVTSGLEATIPKGLLIGTVSQVSEDPQMPFNQAYITPLFDLKRLSNVLIIKKY